MMVINLTYFKVYKWLLDALSKLSTAVALSIFILAQAFAQSPLNGSWIAPGVIVNGDDGRVFMMSPEGRVEALDLLTGAVLWSSAAAAKPLALRDDNVITQTASVSAPSMLILTALNSRTGNVINQTSLDLGSGVDTSIDEELGRSFLVDTGGNNSTDTDLYWRYFQQEVQARPGPTPAVFERFGSIEVSADASVITTNTGFSRNSGRPPYDKPRVLRVQSETPELSIPITDMETGRRYRLDGAPIDSAPVLPGDSVIVDGVTAVESLPTGGLIITEAAPGEEFPPTRRLPGDQFGYSSDDRHILASGYAGRIEASEPYRWRIYERGTFDVAADFMARTSLAPFVVALNRVVYVLQPFEIRRDGRMQDFPLSVVARDAATGKIIWARALRNTRYTGPLPH